MASFRLESGTAAVVVDEHASEIHSFRRKDTDFEYMWQGDPAYWKGRNPTLFPMVGSTWDKILHINGKEYVTGNHGFTRNADFTCIEHDDSHLVMELKSSDETREQYPFDFTLHITYALEGETLKISYEITNENEVVMPFNFGLHPAFNCPLDPEKTFADYRIEFSDPESFHWLNTTLENEAVLDIQDREALAATIIIENPKSTSASLTDGTHSVTVGFEGYRWLAFWSPKAPFVCIEPWYSHTDFEKVEVPFEEREGTQFLDPGKKFTAEYTITIA